MIVILTGAGISQESGIATFRDSGGLWENVNVEDVATPQAFARDPDRVLSFYNARRQALLSPEVKPNAAHLALARLEKECMEPVIVITQNVDDLHERAGTEKLYHMHGELLKIRCGACKRVFQCEEDIHRTTSCPRCGKKAALRPHIVWFEEMPFYLDEIAAALSHCRLFVSIGTSGNVYPAAGFVRMAREAGAQTIELNLERSAGASAFHDGRYGKAGMVVPAWVEGMLSG